MQEPQLDAVEHVRTRSQFSRWSSMILMIAILAVAGFVSALTAMRFAIRGREVDIPLLTGKTPEQAKQILDGLHLKLKVSSSLFSSQVAEGKVLKQIPPSGTRIKIDRKV